MKYYRIYFDEYEGEAFPLIQNGLPDFLISSNNKQKVELGGLKGIRKTLQVLSIETSYSALRVGSNICEVNKNRKILGQVKARAEEPTECTYKYLSKAMKRERKAGLKDSVSL